MKSKKRYTKNDRVLVKSFVGQNIKVILKHRYTTDKAENKLGVNGWYAQINNPAEVQKLRKSGVPYNKNERPKVWVFEWQIIRKC